MRFFTRKGLGVTAFALMFIAAVFTIVDTPLRWWDSFGAQDDSGGAVTTSQLALPTLNSGSTLAPTSVASLAQMLEAAKSVNSNSERDRALRVVAEYAVKQGDYEVAIKAGAASPTNSGRSKTLTFVARCAAKEGLFTLAVEAADKIPINSVQDSTTIEILTMKSEQESSEPIKAIGTLVSTDCR